jgi:predicted metal-binding membrane protein
MIWAFFSIVATALQWLLGSFGLVSDTLMTVNSAALAGAVLLAAGLYQFSSLKNACLKHCRSPAVFLAEHNRRGAMGALRTGAHHGVYCLGFCWALMALLFVGGIMNLYWIAELAIYVLAEKYIPNGALFSEISGTILIVSAGYYLLQAII